MATLETLPDITKLSDRVVRVLGQNPGKFTLQGTNVYLLGTSNPYVLLDAAEGREEFIPTLESALTSVAAPADPTLPDVSDIIISHYHHDHTAGLPSVLSLLQRLFTARNPGKPYTPPRIHKHPGIDPVERDSLVSSVDASLYTPAPNGPLHDLQDSQIISAKDTTLQVLFTPGHTLDSICLHIREDNALYTADTVLGHGTAIFEDLGLYLSSLTKMLEFDGNYTTLIPSHGPVVKEGKDTIATYIKHRLEREGQVLEVLSQPPVAVATAATSHHTTWAIVETLYAAYPKNLWLPAMRGIMLHLTKLESEGRVKRVGIEAMEVQGYKFDNIQWVIDARVPSTSL